MGRLAFIPFLVLLVLAGLAEIAPAGSRDGIFVSSSSRVDGGEILLGEIAQVNVQGFVGQVLEEISLGRSPRPGQVKSISKRQLLSSLRPHRDLIEGITMEIPDRVYVKRNSLTVSEAEIRFFLDDYLGRLYKNKEVSLERLDIPEPEPYPVGEMTMAASGPPRISRNGRFTLGLEVFVDGHREDRIRLSGRLAVYDTVVVASRRLSRGAPLVPSDGRLVRKNILTLRGASPASLARMRDQTLTRDIERGEVILTDWLEPAPLVRKGDVVTLVAQKQSILIQTSGVCLEDGLKNDLIEVENIRSGKLVRGLVRKPATVEVVY